MILKLGFRLVVVAGLTIMSSMPELPEVEILVRHLDRALKNLQVESVEVRRIKAIRPESPLEFENRILHSRFMGVRRRAKHLVFSLTDRAGNQHFQLVGHLGMTGRMYLQGVDAGVPRHAVVVLRLGALAFIYEDPRGFGRFSLDASPLSGLGPEPLEDGFTVEMLGRALARSRQPVKVRIMDQAVLAGLGNIYASEALFHAGIHPTRPAMQIRGTALARLHGEIRSVLRRAVDFGMSASLQLSGPGNGDGLFYFGSQAGVKNGPDERFAVYDREGKPCLQCGKAIRRIELGGRSTYFCASCQRPGRSKDTA